jgi:hypothetical protein
VPVGTSKTILRRTLPVEPLPHKPIERRWHDSCVAHGDLIFNDDAGGGVGLSTLTDRQVPAPVIGDHKVDAVVLVELEPLVGGQALSASYRVFNPSC